MVLNAKIVKIKEIPKEAVNITCYCTNLEYELLAIDCGINDKKRLFLQCTTCYKSFEIKQKTPSISKGGKK